MKAIACYALHYGKEYLAWSIRSIQHAVDEIHVFYTKTPSYGFNGGAVCPDTEEELRKEAHRFLEKPLHWHIVEGCNGEGSHRNKFHEAAARAGAEVYLVVDADEVWLPESAERTVRHVYDSYSASRWLMNFTHFWRSWKYQVNDHFKPVRAIDMRLTPSPGIHTSAIADSSIRIEDQLAPVYHFGYAQSEAIMRYKWTCHGHQAELKHGWMDRFINWKLPDRDLHPVVNDLWDYARPTDSETEAVLRDVMYDHPYKDVDLITDAKVLP